MTVCAPSLPPLVVPEVVGRYRVVKPLGEGGMGQVLLARAQGAAGFEKLVVVKTLRSPGTGERHLLREALIGARMSHEHVVEVLDLVEQDGTYYVVMEYVQGAPLSVLLAGAGLPDRALIHVVRKVARALSYVHAQTDEAGQAMGLMHRDVCPANILVGEHGRVKLSDFGIAALAGEARTSRHLVGKPPYLPPEAFDGAAARPSWDVYALGVVLFEGLSGRKAFAGTTTGQVRREVVRGVAPLSSLRPELPRPLQELVRLATHRDPALRLASAQELGTALDHVAPPQSDDADVLRRALGCARSVEVASKTPLCMPSLGHTVDAKLRCSGERTRRFRRHRHRSRHVMA